MAAHTTGQCDAHGILTRGGDGGHAADADRPDPATRLRLLRLLAEDWEAWLQRPTASAGTIRGVRMPITGQNDGGNGAAKGNAMRDRIHAGKRPTTSWKAKLAVRGRKLRHRLRSGGRGPDDGIVVSLLD
eukprot:6142201-Lingulodinium_polyedra.AAC.1